METNKQTIHTGIVKSIKSIKSQFGHSWLIEMDHGAKYYLSGKSEDLATKMFEENKKAAFTTNEKTSKTGNTYSVIDKVFFTF